MIHLIARYEMILNYDQLISQYKFQKSPSPNHVFNGQFTAVREITEIVR